MEVIQQAHQVICIPLEIRLIPLWNIKLGVNVWGENHVEDHHLEVVGKQREEEMPFTLVFTVTRCQNHGLTPISIYPCVHCSCNASVLTQHFHSFFLMLRGLLQYHRFYLSRLLLLLFIDFLV